MRRSIFTLAISGFTLIGSTVAQMGARIDQFYLDRSVLIPAAIGESEEGYATIIYNKLFTDIPGSPQHTVLNMAMPLPQQNTSFGLYYMKENIAFSEMHNAYATYDYRIPLGSDINLNLAVSAGVLSQNFDATKAVYYDENDAKITALMFSPPVVRADLRASLYLSSEKFYGGFAVSRLPQPHFDYTYYNYAAGYDLQTQANALIGYNATIDDDFTLKPSFHLNMYNWDYLYFQGNVRVDFKDVVWLGFGMNNLFQLGVNAGFKPQDDILVGYSYTVPDGQQRGLLGPMHEFTAKIGFSALGGGSRGDGDDIGSDFDGDGSAMMENERTYKEAIVKTYEDMVNFGLGHDSSGIKLPPIPKLNPEPGHYLVSGLHSSEEKANEQIKQFYMKDVIAFKFYDMRNKSYYVYVKRYNSEKEANKGEFYYEGSVPRVWVREIHK